jgi:fructose-bisphosphate aldolase, class II
MPLVNMREMLRNARSAGYAVGAFNIVDYNSLRAVVEAAEAMTAPVIVQTSAKTVIHWGAEAIVWWTRQLAHRSAIPVALHLDHCKDLNLIERCIEAGWTSVMIDASSLPFEENLALTRRVVEMAGPAGVSVEAELGEIGGVEEDKVVADADARLADPVKAERFCSEAAVDCLAPAIGTAHGIYKGEPKIAFDRLEEIGRRVSLPLALHGGTGLSLEVFRRCICLGCAKVNISTQLKHSFVDEFISLNRADPNQYEPLKYIAAQHRKFRADVAANIEVFGTAGRAAGEKP